MALAGVAIGACDDDPTGPETHELTGEVMFAAVIAPGGECPVLTATTNGTGTVEPGGKFALRQVHCWNPEGPNPAAFTDGRITMAFEQGDSINGTYTGTNQPLSETEAAFFGTVTITRGTGRFVSITGGFDADGAISMVTGQGSYAISGTVTY